MTEPGVDEGKGEGDWGEDAEEGGSQAEGEVLAEEIEADGQAACWFNVNKKTI